MKTSWIIKSVLAGGFLTGALLTAQGCGTSLASYCDKICACTGCSQSQKDDCVTQAEEMRKSADDKGCASDFDAAIGCLSKAQCIDDALSLAGCESELEAFDKCDAGVVGQDACQRYADHLIAKYEDCGIVIASASTSSSVQVTCTEADAKLLGCYDACLPLVNCACLKDPTGNTCADDQKQYNDCMTACGT